MEDNLRRQTLSSMAWRFAERSGAQVIQFVVSIILARLLTPADYGLIGIVTVFITIASVFANSGLGQALVQRKNADDVDFSTVFYFSIAFSLVLYCALYVCAPTIADFYKSPQLTDVVRVLGVTVIIGAFNSTQQAYVQRTMQFKRFFYSTIGGTILSAVAGIMMAYAGYGVWSLVMQQIVMQVGNVIILWFTLKWRPKMVFSIKRAGMLFSYGWKLLCSSILDTVYNNMYSLIIGKFYSQSDLGYYNRGKQFPLVIIQNLNSAIDSVLFPVMSKAQEEKERLKAMVRRSIVTSTFLVFPLMAGMAAVAEAVTLILLTDKWLPAVPYIRFCCFSYAFWPVHTANLQAIKAMGRSDIYLRLEIAKKVIGIIILVVTIPYGLYTMMIGRCVSTIISTFINAYPNRKLLGYSYREQLRDILPSFALAIVMCLIVLSVELLNLNMWATISVQVVVGAVVYIGGAKLFKLESYSYIKNIANSYIKR